MRISKDTRQKVFERDEYKCRYCGKKVSNSSAHIDHVVPLGKGGTSELSNLATACIECNVLKGDKLVEFISTPIAKQIAKGWIWAYLRAPILTMVSSLVTAAIVVGGIFLFELQTRKQREAKLADDLNLAAQVERLDKTEESLKQLLSFVSEQRNSIKNSEVAIKALKEEREKLTPLVETDREKVEALFRVQEERNRASVVKERWIGFGIGILASITASAVIIVIKFLTGRKKEAQQEAAEKPATADEST
jgi:hypothetical protein